MANYSQDQFEDMLAESPVEAVEFLSQCARSGNADAMFVLGKAYYDGEGVKTDVHKCAELLTQAASLGHVGALHDLACFYYYGYGFPDGFRNLEKSAELLGEAARRGYTPSMTFLGSMYENGEGIAQSYEMAKALYERAANLGDELGRRYLFRIRRINGV